MSGDSYSNELLGMPAPAHFNGIFGWAGPSDSAPVRTHKFAGHSGVRKGRKQKRRARRQAQRRSR